MTVTVARPPESAHPSRSRLAHRVPGQLLPDPRRVIARLFMPQPEPGSPSRSAATVNRILALPDDVVQAEADRVLVSFSARHHDLRGLLAGHMAAVAAEVPGLTGLSSARALLIGASFTAEYAVEGAALCNPSAVPHPDQSGLLPGQLRVAMSLRGIGEGHLSSIGFASAVVGPGSAWAFEERELPAVAGTATSPAGGRSPLPDASWGVDFPADTDLSQQVLLPAAPEESNGLEDARFVRFTDDTGAVDYRATYTAYDGQRISPRLLTSRDLSSFTAHRLSGPAARNKGMALFPRMVHGRHLALCRTDGVSNSLTSSADGITWDAPLLVQVPERSWEIIQIGNCGSPIETDRGWLVLTHGVGSMRTYSIGAILLDLDDPSIMVARLDEPLLRTAPDERDGYVPQVVYSCGGLVHDGLLWVPHGIGDVRIGVVWCSLAQVLDAMTPC